MDRLKQILFKAQSNKKINWLLSKKVLEEAIDEFPNEKKIYWELAELLNSKKIYTDAIKNYQKALEYDKNNRDIIFKIATCFLTINEFALALDYYNQIYDDFPELLYNKAFALSRLNKTTQSIDYLEKLIDTNPPNDLPYLFLAELYYSHGLFKKSIETLTKAEHVFGEKGAIYFMKGISYSQIKNWLQAVSNFSKAYKLNFRYQNFYRDYAVALEKIGKDNIAIEMLKKNIKIYPKDFQSYFHLIRLYFEKQDYKNTSELIKQAKKSANTKNKISLELFEKEISMYLKTEK